MLGFVGEDDAEFAAFLPIERSWLVCRSSPLLKDHDTAFQSLLPESIGEPEDVKIHVRQCGREFSLSCCLPLPLLNSQQQPYFPIQTSVLLSPSARLYAPNSRALHAQLLQTDSASDWPCCFPTPMPSRWLHCHSAPRIPHQPASRCNSRRSRSWTHAQHPWAEDTFLLPPLYAS